MNIDDLLRAAVAKGASDLHVKVGAYPMARVSGVLIPVSEEKRLMNEDTLAMGAQMMSSDQREKFTKSQEVDLAYSVAGSRPIPRATSSSSAARWAWCFASSPRKS